MTISTQRIASWANQAREAYAARVAGESASAWWDAVIVTASSARQAGRYRDEIRQRREQGKLPANVVYLVAPDTGDEPIGSGGATLNAIRLLAEESVRHDLDGFLEAWWATRRVFIIHSGGDSGRLPQSSISGKLFTVVPAKTPWGEVSTVFDELLIQSTAWAQRMPSGLLVSSGDVILAFDSQSLKLDRPGVTGIAMRQPAKIASQHGVYVADEQGRVYSYLQKPSVAQIKAAGGLLAHDEVALDTGLMRFDPAVCARLTELAGIRRHEEPWGVDRGIPKPAGAGPARIDLYRHVTLLLTGQWRPDLQSTAAMRELAGALDATPFWCSVVEGRFRHIGTTRLLHRLFTEQAEYKQLSDAQQSCGSLSPAGIESGGIIVDSVVAAGSEIEPETIVIECDLQQPIRAGRGAILHGLTGLDGVAADALRAPEDTVLHQIPVRLPDGLKGTVIRVYGVADDPKENLSSDHATWLGCPILKQLEDLGLDSEVVWAGIPPEHRSLWNAQLFPLASPPEAWACARWMTGYAGDFSRERWTRMTRLSLASSAQWADTQAIVEAQNSRRQNSWKQTAVSLARAGADIRSLVAHAPGVGPLASTGRELAFEGERLLTETPSQAASHYFQAGLFLAQAGLVEEAERARENAFLAVQRAVDAGVLSNALEAAGSAWCAEAVTVSAPPRVDFGGGWSDTPPFCLDWGGTVLNMAVTIDGRYPISARLRRLKLPFVRCLSEDTSETAEYRSAEEFLAPLGPGCPFSIPRAALKLIGIPRQGESLSATLSGYGGGLEIRTRVDLPVGSGLGTSSILAAALLRAFAEMLGASLTPHNLSDLVMLLEQRITTGGGWQDQVGGIFPGVKLTFSGPGLRQRLRVEILDWSQGKQADFCSRFFLYYTGIQRIAKNLLQQVVGRYLAREVLAVQVLHSIKTLALEMAHAMREGDWAYLGELMDRHWELNQVLDPHTTSAPINVLLHEVRPYLAGAKLAGAGGGGFLMLLARSPEAAQELREKLSRPAAVGAGRLYEFGIAKDGLRVECSQEETSESGGACRSTNTASPEAG